MALTPKQEAFCHAYIETSNASEAYRRCYKAGNMKPEVVWVKACELLKSGNVAVRVAELQQLHRERHMVTVDTITSELDELKELAQADRQYSPAITAVMGKAKVHGLLVEKNEVTGKNGGAIAFKAEQHSDDELDARIVELLGKTGAGGAVIAPGGEAAKKH